MLQTPQGCFHIHTSGRVQGDSYALSSWTPLLFEETPSPSVVKGSEHRGSLSCSLTSRELLGSEGSGRAASVSVSILLLLDPACSGFPCLMWNSLRGTCCIHPSRTTGSASLYPSGRVRTIYGHLLDSSSTEALSWQPEPCGSLAGVRVQDRKQYPAEEHCVLSIAHVPPHPFIKAPIPNKMMLRAQVLESN